MRHEFLDTNAFSALRAKLMASAAAGDEDARSDLEFLSGIVGACTEYISKVDEFEMKTAASKISDSGDSYRTVFEACDRSRHNAHESAIAKVSALNRMSSLYGVGPVFTGDTSNRYNIGDFCGELGLWIFTSRTL